MKSDGIISRDGRVISPSLTRQTRFVFRNGKGCDVWDVDGRRYLDFTAFIAVNSTGHCNPAINKAIARQLGQGSHCAFSDFYADLPVRFAEKLLALMPRGFGKVFLSNSGTESVEAAYKLARWHTNKKWVIAFEGSFHGRTMGSLSMTKSKQVQRERFEPFLPVVHVPFPYCHKLKMEPEECSHYCLGQLEDRMRAMRHDLAAVFMEPIQGEGGYVVPPASFVHGVRKLCDDYSALLCDDEVQAGCYRTGKFLAMENFGVKPDIVSMAKAIGGGLPLGATIAPDRIMDWPPGSHANTFGGNLLACAAGIATLDFMEEKKLGDNAKKVGDAMLRRLVKMEKHGLVCDVRGMGLMIGVEICDPRTRKAVLDNALKKGLLLLPAGDSVIRMSPPLTITEKQAMRGLDIFEDAVRESLKDSTAKSRS